MVNMLLPRIYNVSNKELNTEFLQIVGQAGIDGKTPSGHLHLIGYYRKTLEPRLS
jgi:hypothetical protein